MADPIASDAGCHGEYLMSTALIQFLAAATIIVVAGTILTRCADAMAELTRLSRVLVGSIFLAAATSLPELAVDIHAIRLNLPNMAVGDLLGSCLFNLFILGIADVSHRTGGVMLSRTAASHALTGANSIALAALVGLFIMFESQTNPSGIAGFSYGSVAVLIAYLLGVRLTFFDQRAAAEAIGEKPETKELQPGSWTLRRAISGYAFAALAILLVAPYLARSAGQIAELTGLSGTFVGTTLVALSTSLPELVTTFAAVRIGAYDLAIGNVFGSNAFNLLMLFPLDMVYGGALFTALAPTHALTCFAVILVSSVVILGQLYRVERRILFVEPDAGLVITLVVGTLWLVYLAE